MNLIIDHGNSAIKLYVFNGNDVVCEQKVTEQELMPAVHRCLKMFSIKHSIYSCVGKFNAEVEQVLDKTTSYIRFDWRVPVPIKNLYQSPQTLGMDRLAAAVGANYLYPGQNVLIVDIGTAITYDVVTNRAEFLGGNISPGPELRFRALHEFTAKLPQVELAHPANYLGKNTREAILNGVVWGIVQEIQGYIENLSLSFENLRTILTGGYAKFFEKKIKNTIFVKLKLVPLGLNRVLEFNKQ